MAQFIAAPTVEKATPLLLADYLHIIDSADTNNDKWIRAQRIVELLGDGWTPANETWGVVDANTFIVEGVNVVSKYPVGAKWKCTIDGTDIQGYIIGTSLSGSGTLIEVCGNDIILGYDVEANSNYYSTASNPLGFPHWFDYTPTLTGGNADLSGYDVAKYAIVGRKVTIVFIAENRTLSGSAGSIIISLPINPLRELYHISNIYYNSAHTAVFFRISPAGIEITKDINAGSWTTSETGIYIRFILEFDI